MQIRQAKSVYIHLDYIYLSVQYASQNMSTSFRALGFVMMQKSRLGDDAKDESCYAYEYRSTNSHMSFWGLCKRYVTRLYLHIIICLHTTICLHVSVHVYIQHMFPSFVTWWVIRDKWHESFVTYDVSHAWFVFEYIQNMFPVSMTSLHIQSSVYLYLSVSMIVCLYYGLATISRLLKMIGLFCRIVSVL